mmetsp:Transcript_16798/g.37668  ORF Transcript_16798/g.37668 Transcript_16798/m.37668 type:complete len:220 (-) Transcript_16798:1534-2193(-)
MWSPSTTMRNPSRAASISCTRLRTLLSSTGGWRTRARSRGGDRRRRAPRITRGRSAASRALVPGWRPNGWIVCPTTRMSACWPCLASQGPCSAPSCAHPPRVSIWLTSRISIRSQTKARSTPRRASCGSRRLVCGLRALELTRISASCTATSRPTLTRCVVRGTTSFCCRRSIQAIPSGPIPSGPTASTRWRLTSLGTARRAAPSPRAGCSSPSPCSKR